MIYLLLNIASSALVSVFMRLSEGKAAGRVSMLAANYLTCSGLALAYSLAGGRPPTGGLAVTAGLGVVGGVLYLLAFVLLQFNVGKNGVVLASAFMKLGLLVPVTLSVALFGESPTVAQGAGFAVAVAAILLMNWRSERNGDGRKSASAVWLVLLLLFAGGANAMSKVFGQWGAAGWSEWFLVFIFGSALVLALGVARRRGEKLGKRELLYGALIGVPNYFSSRFLLLALDSLPAVLVYPTSNMAALAAVTLVGVALFRERLDRRQWLGMAMILAALALLNL